MRDNLADHCRESYVGLTGKSINTRTLLGVEIDCWREIAISQVILSNSRSASPPSRRLSRSHVVGSLPARPGHSRDTLVTETTWTYSRLCAEVPAGVNSRDTGVEEIAGQHPVAWPRFPQNFGPPVFSNTR